MKRYYTLKKASKLIGAKQARTYKKYPDNTNDVDNVAERIMKMLNRHSEKNFIFERKFFHRYILNCFELTVKKEIETKYAKQLF